MGDSRVLPASAGMIPSTYNKIGELQSAPRIRGDDPKSYVAYPYAAQCSPHPRG